MSKKARILSFSNSLKDGISPTDISFFVREYRRKSQSPLMILQKTQAAVAAAILSVQYGFSRTRNCDVYSYVKVYSEMT